MELSLTRRHRPGGLFDSSFDDLFGSFFSDAARTHSRVLNLDYSLSDDEKEYVLDVEMPGHRGSPVLSREGQTLRLDWIDRFGAAKSLRRTLPDDAQMTKVAATLKSGVLTVRVPRGSPAEVSAVIPITEV